MNENIKYGLIFLGGLAVGALGAAAVSRNGLTMKPLATDILSRGMDVKDAMLGKVEIVKENIEDMVAEAHHAAEQRKDKRDAHCAAQGETQCADNSESAATAKATS